MGRLYIVLVFISISQFACTTTNQLNANSNTVLANQVAPSNITETHKDAEIDLNAEEINAQKLVQSGINFHFTMNVDGKDFTAHSYGSSDGIDIGTYSAANLSIHNKEHQAIDCFNEHQANVSKFLKQELLEDKNKIQSKRYVAINNQQEFEIGILKSNTCQIYDSKSLKHLLAFEMWENTL